MKSALITGINGQDGSYLAEFLLEKGYEVYGLDRNSNTTLIEHIKKEIHLIKGDLTDSHSLEEAIKIIQPDEIYNLAAQSSVGLSWEKPVLTTQPMPSLLPLF